MENDTLSSTSPLITVSALVETPFMEVPLYILCITNIYTICITCIRIGNKYSN